MARTEATRTIKLIVDTSDFTYSELARAAGCSGENVRRACENYGEDMSIDAFQAISDYLTANGEKRHLGALDKSPRPPAETNGSLDDEMADMMRHLVGADEALRESNFGDVRRHVDAMRQVMTRVDAEFHDAKD